MLKTSSKKVLVKNRRANFNYAFSEFQVAGIVLRGFEVKSVKSGQADIRDSFVRIERGEAWLINAHISRWKYATMKEYDPVARRKLLLKKREINNLQVAQDAKRLSLIPVELFVERGKIKVRIGIGKGRKKYDKRRKIREREQKKQIRQDLAKVSKY